MGCGGKNNLPKKWKKKGMKREKGDVKMGCEKEQIIHRKNGCGEKLMIWG